jgi:disulfide bond formation protein DsbB
MNRIHLFLLFVIFLLIPLSAPAFSSLLPVSLLGCDSGVAQDVAVARECPPQIAQVNDLSALELSSGIADASATGKMTSVQTSSAPLNLREFMQNDQSESRKQWLLLTVFAALILLAARIAPSMK